MKYSSDSYQFLLVFSISDLKICRFTQQSLFINYPLGNPFNNLADWCFRKPHCIKCHLWVAQKGCRSLFVNKFRFNSKKFSEFQCDLTDRESIRASDGPIFPEMPRIMISPSIRENISTVSAPGLESSSSNCSSLPILSTYLTIFFKQN